VITALLIFIGSGLGGVTRYFVSMTIYSFLGTRFPFGTLFINVSGSLIMGLLFALIMERLSGLSSELRALLLIGFLGGYTTFSSFSIETLNLIENGQIKAACLNMILSVVLCVLAAWIGVKLGRMV
jgi:CrcB protein